MLWSVNKNSGSQSLGELPGVAILGADAHTLMPGG